MQGQVKPHRLQRRSSVFGGMKPLLGSHVGRVGTDQMGNARRGAEQVPIPKSSLERLIIHQRASVAFAVCMLWMVTDPGCSQDAQQEPAGAASRGGPGRLAPRQDAQQEPRAGPRIGPGRLSSRPTMTKTSSNNNLPALDGHDNGFEKPEVENRLEQGVYKNKRAALADRKRDLFEQRGRSTLTNANDDLEKLRASFCRCVSPWPHDSPFVLSPDECGVEALLMPRLIRFWFSF